jgi:hypothetical protein
MPARLENLTSRPVSLVLNSGSALHLPPGYALELDPAEIIGNATVEKLRDRLVVAVSGPDDAPATQSGTREAGGTAAAAADPAGKSPPRKPTGTG